MTRKKKTRSLKRIHSVKTGNSSKLKRASTVDRQSTNLKAKAKPKSVYQKFLDENPDAIEKQQQPKSPASTEKKQNAEKIALDKAASKKTKDSRSKEEQQEVEREPDLLSQLDNKNFNDFY